MMRTLYRFLTGARALFGNFPWQRVCEIDWGDGRWEIGLERDDGVDVLYYIDKREVSDEKINSVSLVR